MSAWKTTLIYSGFASIWIIFSDRLVELIGIPALHTYKGLAFIVLSATLLFFYLRRKLLLQEQTEQVLARTAEGKSRLVAAVSHDLRQPLQSLALFAAVLERDPGLSPRSRQAVECLGQSVDRMGQLLGAILQLAQADVGVIRRDPQPVALNAIFAALAEEMAPQAEAKGLALRYVRTSVVVESDPVLLLTILRNFVANAIRYTEHGRIVIGCRRRGTECLIGVYDTGRGIAADQLDFVFEEFFQVDNPSRDYRLGLGLGLSVVNRLARLLGHRVSVRSTLGKGSGFCLTAPRLIASPADRTAAERQAALP